MWLPFVLPHLHSTRFVMVDLPGFGSAFDESVRGESAVGAYADIIKGIIFKEGDGETSLVAFSLGASACLKLLCDEPQLPISRYMHIDHTPWSQNDSHWNGGIDSTLLTRFKGLCDHAKVFPGSENLPNGELPAELSQHYDSVLSFLRETCFQNSFASLLNKLVDKSSLSKQFFSNRIAWRWAHAIFRDYYLGSIDLRERLSKITVPVSLVSGNSSEICNAEAVSFMENEIKHCDVVGFTGGHDFMVNQFLPFSRHFGSFINK